MRVRGGGDLVGGWAGGGKLELVKRLKNSFVEISYRWYTTLWDFLRLEFYLGAQVAGGFGVVKVDPGGVVLVLHFDPELSGAEHQLCLNLMRGLKVESERIRNSL